MRDEGKTKRGRRPSVVGFERSSDYYFGKAKENRQSGRTADALKLALKALEGDENDAQKLLEAAVLAAQTGFCDLGSWLINRAILSGAPALECLNAMCANLIARNRTTEAYRAVATCLEHGGRALLMRTLPPPVNGANAQSERPQSRRERIALSRLQKAIELYHDGHLTDGGKLIRRALERLKLDAMAHALAAQVLSQREPAWADRLLAFSSSMQMPEGAELVKYRCARAMAYMNMNQLEAARRELDFTVPQSLERPLRSYLLMCLGRAGLGAKAHELVRLWLKNEGVNRELLHQLSVAACLTGLKGAKAEEGWRAICSIDAGDYAAQRLLSSLRNGSLRPSPVDFMDGLPTDLMMELLAELSDFSQDPDPAGRWAADAPFRQWVTRAICDCGHKALQGMALQVLLCLNTQEIVSCCRALSLHAELGEDERNMIKRILGALGRDTAPLPGYEILPEATQPLGSELMDAQALWVRTIYRNALDYLRSLRVWECERPLARRLIQMTSEPALRRACFREPDVAEAALVLDVLRHSRRSYARRSVERDYELRPRQLDRMLSRVKQALGPGKINHQAGQSNV